MPCRSTIRLTTHFTRETTDNQFSSGRAEMRNASRHAATCWEIVDSQAHRKPISCWPCLGRPHTRRARESGWLVARRAAQLGGLQRGHRSAQYRCFAVRLKRLKTHGVRFSDGGVHLQHSTSRWMTTCVLIPTLGRTDLARLYCPSNWHLSPAARMFSRGEYYPPEYYRRLGLSAKQRAAQSTDLRLKEAFQDVHPRGRT